MKKNNLITIKDLSFSYDSESEENKTFVLSDINLEIAEGEFVAIVGRNGSGKSTLAMHLNALLLPTSGDVIVKGMNTKDEEKLWDIRKNVGMVFQNPDNQLISSVIEDDVAFGPENLGIPSSEIRKKVDDALNAVGMYEYRKKAPHLLSGGQKQRVAVAGVIAMGTECIVFDESTAMLDPIGRRDILAIAKKLHKEGHTIVLITHFMEEAAQADKIIIMADGKIVKTDKPEKIFRDKKLLDTYGLEVPFAVKLSDALTKRGFDIPKDIVTEEELADYLCKLK